MEAIKAKVLISSYFQDSGHKAHRIYFEPHFEQAEKDLALVQENSMKNYELAECEIYNWDEIKSEIIKNSK